MPCAVCRSTNQKTLSAEVNIHPPALLINMDKPTVWAFPTILICANCGFTEFALSETELRDLLARSENEWEAV